MLASASALAAETMSEQAVRAVMLFNFLKFTEWPVAAANTQIRICVATGDPELLAAVDALAGRQIRGRALTIERFRQQTTCNVIYVDSRQRWQSLWDNHAAPTQALTIGGYSGFTTDGGMIEIALHDGSTRFDINLQEAKRAGLRFYPQLLRLARRVVD